MAHTPEEWFTQSEYDFQTAQVMLTSGRNIYAVFMSHLAIEKALKGIYHKKFDELPPRTHSLVAFLKMNELKPPPSVGEFIADLDQASVATRYPEELAKLSAAYPRPIVEGILSQTMEASCMGKKDVLDILSRFRAALELKKIRVEKVVLFGSWAKGTAGEFSDIDVVVVSPDFGGKDLWSRAKLLGSAVYQVFAPIQAVALTPQEWEGKTSTVCELAKDGEVLAV